MLRSLEIKIVEGSWDQCFHTLLYLYFDSTHLSYE